MPVTSPLPLTTPLQLLYVYNDSRTVPELLSTVLPGPTAPFYSRRQTGRRVDERRPQR